MQAEGIGAPPPAPIVLVSPDMRPSVMGVARSLAREGLLQKFVTTVAFGKRSKRTNLNFVPTRWREALRRKMRRREVPAFLDAPVETLAFQEIINLAARHIGLGDVIGHYVWEWAETTFDRRVAGRWAGSTPCLYGCEHASVETFRRQKESGGYNILWQVIAHHQTVFKFLREEYEAFPDAMTPYVRKMFDSAPRVNERKDVQYECADLIVTNSEFSRQTFIKAGLPAEKVTAVPTGCPLVLTGVVKGRERAEGSMVFLCAGSQSLRKGIPYLLDAWRHLPLASWAELWLVGNSELPERLLRGLPSNVTLRPPVSRDELERIFRRASVLVLPTLCEGLAHIILEAMAAGLAVITTENSGCGNLVEDGVNGWKVPIRDAEALAERIAWCLGRPEEVVEMQRQSLRKANDWQEEHFAKAHADLIKVFLSGKGITADTAEFMPTAEACLSV